LAPRQKRIVAPVTARACADLRSPTCEAEIATGDTDLSNPLIGRT
jgi:hypothetical protein